MNIENITQQLGNVNLNISNCKLCKARPIEQSNMLLLCNQCHINYMHFMDKKQCITCGSYFSHPNEEYNECYACIRMYQ